jgi:hypothetical protein
MAVVQEFDLDIKPTKIVKGQGLCKLAVEAQYLINAEDSRWENEFSLWYSEALICLISYTIDPFQKK